jgi:hypothetical protein
MLMAPNEDVLFDHFVLGLHGADRRPKSQLAQCEPRSRPQGASSAYARATFEATQAGGDLPLDYILSGDT